MYSTEASERAISESFKSLPALFPQLLCLLIEGHPELDPSSLAAADSTCAHSLELLDFARCRQELTSNLLYPEIFRRLVYIDITYVPGSLRSAIQSSLNPTYVPELRVLKAQGREVDDATAQLLFQTFKLQLWSIDLSDNKLSDNAIDALLAHCFSSLSFRGDAHFEVEGMLVLPKDIGTYQYGPFEFVQESSHSASFTHPERYLTDAPIYSRTADQPELQEWQTVRSDGTKPLRRDDASAVKEMLLENALSSTDKNLRQPIRDLHLPRGGITHLYLNRNNITTNGIGRLLRLSSGRLEHFECDTCTHAPFIPPPDEAHRQTRLGGIFDSTHLFRPAISSNLRSLRANHSLVTQVPDIITDKLPLAAVLRLSETVFSKNISRAYPQRFVPDTNPRIASLSLTGIPARSTGRVIEQLTSFLDFATLQQKSIRQTRESLKGGRRITTLSGLRHIRLELDPDFTDDDTVFAPSSGHNIDYDKLLDPGDTDFGSNDSGDGSFSFFEDTRRTRPPKSAPHPTPSTSTDQYSQWTSGRLKSAPYSDTDSHFVTYHHSDAATSWTGNVFSVPVWIGPGTIGPHAAVNAYMWNLQNAALRAGGGVGPATPAHVAAGAPSGAYIFRAAWDAIIWPLDLNLAIRGCIENEKAQREPLRDVAAAIKEYRGRTRGTEGHWDGTLELVRAHGPARYHASEYWR